MNIKQNILLRGVICGFCTYLPRAFSGYTFTKFCYLQNSRLHFIGTWRNRYRKRFPSFSNGFKCTSSNIKASAPKTAVIHVDMVNSKPLAVVTVAFLYLSFSFYDGYIGVVNYTDFGVMRFFIL